MPTLLCIGGPLHLGRATIARSASSFEVSVVPTDPVERTPLGRWALRDILEIREIEGLTGQKVSPPTVPADNTAYVMARYLRRQIGSHRAPNGRAWDLLVLEDMPDAELALWLLELGRGSPRRKGEGTDENAST